MLYTVFILFDGRCVSWAGRRGELDVTSNQISDAVVCMYAICMYVCMYFPICMYAVVCMYAICMYVCMYFPMENGIHHPPGRRHFPGQKAPSLPLPQPASDPLFFVCTGHSGLLSSLSNAHEPFPMVKAL